MGIWQTFSQGICKMKLSLQGIYLLPIMSWTFNRKLEFWKIYHCELDNCPILKEFCDDNNGDINKYSFCKLKYVWICKIWISQWTIIFQMTNAYITKSHMDKRDLCKGQVRLICFYVTEFLKFTVLVLDSMCNYSFLKKL